MKVLVTGAGGLIGSAVCELAKAEGHKVVGVESDHRGQWFGPAGSVKWRTEELERLGIVVFHGDFRHFVTAEPLRGVDAVVHCAGQPSHDFSHRENLEDSAINYMGTVGLLEQVRNHSKDARFVFLSTNKVYGDRINRVPMLAAPTRYVLGASAPGVSEAGVNEEFPVDDSLHTPFGVSKLAADLMVQEFKRSYGLRTVVLRCGCVTGTSGSAVELHGFLGYLVRCAVWGRPYTVYGHGGLQVRDNIDAFDLAAAILAWLAAPKGCVYNMGGGPKNSVSVLEAISYLRGRGFEFEVEDGPPRLGDHAWWVTDTARFERDYPTWKRTRSVWEVVDEMVIIEKARKVGGDSGHLHRAGVQPSFI